MAGAGLENEAPATGQPISAVLRSVVLFFLNALRVVLNLFTANIGTKQQQQRQEDQKQHQNGHHHHNQASLTATGEEATTNKSNCITATATERKQAEGDIAARAAAANTSSPAAHRTFTNKNNSTTTNTNNHNNHNKTDKEFSNDNNATDVAADVDGNTAMAAGRAIAPHVKAAQKRIVPAVPKVIPALPRVALPPPPNKREPLASVQNKGAAAPAAPANPNGSATQSDTSETIGNENTNNTDLGDQLSRLNLNGSATAKAFKLTTEDPATTDGTSTSRPQSRGNAGVAAAAAGAAIERPSSTASSPCCPQHAKPSTPVPTPAALAALPTFGSTPEVTRAAPVVVQTISHEQTGAVISSVEAGDGNTVHIFNGIPETPEEAAERMRHSAFMREALDMVRFYLSFCLFSEFLWLFLPLFFVRVEILFCDVLPPWRVCSWCYHRLPPWLPCWVRRSQGALCWSLYMILQSCYSFG